MIRLPILLITITGKLLAIGLLAGATWPHENSNIAVDPAVRFGILENGMRYALMKNSEPPEQIALRLHVAAGSIHEKEGQRGLAHFLEHMAFNGSKNFPDVEALISQMQRLGIGFGAHANAYTGYDETVYMLDLPNGSEEVVDLAFTVMRDFADGLLIEAEEIEKERGVILAEKKSRDSVNRRLFEQEIEFLLPDFLASKRSPIGIEEVIETAPRERFVEFYETYYIPSRLSFVAVGDFDPEVFEKEIIASFEGMKAVEPKAPPLDLGPIPEGFGFQTAVFIDEEVSQDELTLGALRPYSFEQDTVESRLERLPLSIANAIINRRFQILSKGEGSPISGGSASYFNWLNAIESVEVSVAPEDGKWPEAIAILEHELRRALEYGFTEAELEEVRANLLNAYEEAAIRAPTRTSPALASGLFRSIHRQTVFSHPEENLRIYKKGLIAVTAEDCHVALKDAWKETDLSLTLTTKSAEADAEKQLTELYKASQLITLEPPRKEAKQEFAYTDFGPAGTVTKETHITDLDFKQYVLSNRIRVNLKETDFKKNSVLVKARFGGGTLTQPKDKTGLKMVAAALMNGGGLGQHSNDDLARILAGKNVSYSFGIGDDAFSLSGSTTPKDLQLQLQLMCAALTDPGYRDEALRQLHKQMPPLASQLKHTLGGAMAEMQSWFRGHDGRFAKPDPDRIPEYTKDDVQSWITKDLSESYLELTIVGDFEIKNALPMILKTFGALSDREDAIARHEEKRVVDTPSFPTSKTFTYSSKIDKAAALVTWKGSANERDVKESRRMNILAKILGDRLRKILREELGSSYSPSAGFSMSPVFDTAFLTSSSVATSTETALLNEKMLEIGQSLATDGATQDELDRALTPLIEGLPKSLRQNGHWLNVIMAQSQAQPYRLDWARERDADYASISLSEVNALARKYLQPENAAIVTLKSDAITEASL
ncbi:MAG: insulinase family protein [Verrucomicrobiota bacterium]